MPGIGFAMSIERLIMALKAENIELPLEHSIDCYVVALGEKRKTMLQKLRSIFVKLDCQLKRLFRSQNESTI